VFLDDGTPIQDGIPDDGFTILRLGRSRADLNGLAAAIRSRGAPVTVLEIPDEAPRAVYGHDLLLLRPDMHIVWRGNRVPEDPHALAAVATGATYTPRHGADGERDE
jgi:hypothetical protein